MELNKYGKAMYQVSNPGICFWEGLGSFFMGRNVETGEAWDESLDDNVVKSLHEISSNIGAGHREVFLADNFGYVWCFKDRETFEDSLLCRIEDGKYFSLSEEKHPRIKNAVKDLRNAYNGYHLKFTSILFEDPHYQPGPMDDELLNNPKPRIRIYLAKNAGKEFAETLEVILCEYEILEAAKA